MKSIAPATLVPLLLVLACSPAAEVAQPAASPEPAPPSAPAAVALPSAETSAVAPTAEERKKAEEAQKLEADFAELRRAHDAEIARLTPEIRAEAKALSEKAYPTAAAALKAAMAGKHRRPEHAARDTQRHPRETLEAFGFKPTQTVLEFGPGEGWYTELLAPSLAARGKLLVTLTDPNGPADQRETLYGQRVQLFLDRLPEAYSKVERITIQPKAPNLGVEAKIDLILAIRTLHGMNNAKTLRPWLAQFHRALKPGGVLGVVQHRAGEGANPDESGKKGYLPEAYVIQEVQSAGFKLASKSEINANPKDTKDYPEGVWALPPTLRMGNQDRDKYVAIGESDRMTLKFVKAAP